ncbi:YggT family protein [Bacillus sp. OAE603]|uniref:YggT family protein n=1 Tax=Gottfriedia sp. OAE603 TaxID=2663872 RepID=UPI00178ABD28
MDFILSILYHAIQIYQTILVIHIIMSWFPQVQQSSFGRFIGRIAEPYLEPFRRIIPSIGMFDFSPIVALITLQFAMRGIFALSTYF